MGDQTTFPEHFFEFRCVSEGRFTELVVHDSDIGQRCWRGYANAQRFTQGFFGSKPLGQESPRIAGLVEISALLDRQQFLQRAFAMSRIKLAKSGDGNDIGANPGDHLAKVCASRIRSFISRTASRNPTKIARLTMA